MNFTEAVKLARQDVETGYTYLYEQTYSEALYVALKYMKQEDSAYDVLQDAYIKAFRNLEQLEDPEKFTSWFHMIVSRTALNELKKKTPLLFTQLETEDKTYDIVNSFRDEYTDNQPEFVMDQRETSRLVQEIIDTLSDEQRTCVTMYYIQEFSVKEIATILDVSENTVKSRLNYARKKIEEKVKELESKGTKLYGFAPLPFFILLLKKEFVVKASQGVSMQTYAAVMASIGSKIQTAAGIGTTTTVAKSIGVGTKIIIATVATAVVVGGGILGYSKLSMQKEADETLNGELNNTEISAGNEANIAFEDYLSKQNILTGKEYNTYIEVDDNNDRSQIWSGDPFYDGIVTYSIEDVDNDDVNELIVVEGKETGELTLCLLEYDVDKKEVMYLDRTEINAVPTDANGFYAHWSIVKGEQTYFLYDYYIEYSILADGYYRGFSFFEFTNDGMHELAAYYMAGSDQGVDEPEYDNEIKKVFQCANQTVDDEQLYDIEYNVNFLDYIDGQLIGKIETTDIVSYEECFEWEEKAVQYAHDYVEPDGWEKKKRVSIGKIY